MKTSKLKVLLQGLYPQGFVVSLGLKYSHKIRYSGVMIG